MEVIFSQSGSQYNVFWLVFKGHPASPAAWVRADVVAFWGAKCYLYLRDLEECWILGAEGMGATASLADLPGPT